jgi:hemoglobin
VLLLEVNVDVARVRTDRGVIGEVRRGQRLDSILVQKDYYLVALGDRRGWIRKSDVRVVEVDMTKRLWHRLRGEANVKRIVDDLVAAAATDPKVDFFRGGKYALDADQIAKLKKHLVEQISDATGGPYKYTGKSMKEVHKGMSITKAQFDAAAGHLEDALKKNGAKPDDVKAVMAVIASTEKDIVEQK